MTLFKSSERALISITNLDPLFELIPLQPAFVPETDDLMIETTVCFHFYGLIFMKIFADNIKQVKCAEIG